MNGQRIEGAVKLAPGDQIKCGSTLMTFALAPDDKKTSMVSMMPGEDFDLTVESKSPRNPQAMILGAPDPAMAAMEHLRVIYHLTALTASTLDRTELLNQVMDLIFSEFLADRGFILLQEHPTDRPDPVVVRYRVKPKNLDEGRIPVSRPASTTTWPSTMVAR